MSDNLTRTPDCYDGAMTIERDTGGDPMCELSSQPLTIEALDDSGSNEVRFSFQNNWPTTIDNIDLYYDRGDGLGKQCLSLKMLYSGAIYPGTLAVACDAITQTAEVEVAVSNTRITFSSYRGNCGVLGPQTCSYIFRIPCSADVMCDSSHRRLEDSVFSEL